MDGGASVSWTTQIARNFNRYVPPFDRSHFDSVLLTLCIIALTGLLLFGSTTSGSSATLELWLQAASQFHEKHHVAIGLK